MAAPYYAREIMTRRLITLNPAMDVFEAIDVLLKNRISGAPVVDDNGQYVGVFSERDSLNMLVTAAYEQLPTTQVEGFINRENPTIEEHTDVLTIAQIFLNSHARRLPVLKDGVLVGNVSRRDVLRAIHGAVMKSENPTSQLLYLSSLISIEQAPMQ